MRRSRPRRPATLFRGSELLRMGTMVVMLGVLYLLITRARDPHLWQWFTPQAQAPDAAGPQGIDVAIHAGDAGEPPADDGTPAAIPALDRKAPQAGPNDTDPEERAAADEELQAITDKTPLVKEEMPAYWRLLGWEQHQSTRELLQRSDTQVKFRELYHNAARWRGKLVSFPVHLNRTMPVQDVADNPLGIGKLHEVFGWNSDSQPNWYWLVVPELPPGMPEGDIYEEGTFVGYFLKLISYEDRQGKVQTAPLLVGRLIWHPAPDRRVAQREEWRWTFYGFAGLAVLFALRWGLTLRNRSRQSSGRPTGRRGPERSVDDWLDNAESATGAEASTGDESGDGESADEWRRGPPTWN